jgi:hypothetical protein
MALPALTATLRQPAGGVFARPGVAIAALSLGSLIGLAGGVYAWHRMRAVPAETPVPAATTAATTAPPAETAKPEPPPVAAVETAAPAPTTSASAAPSAAPLPKKPGGKPSGKLPATPVYSQE